MPKFILNDETQRNSYGFKIKTEGILLDRFQKNPVMLDGHSSANLSVIGFWENIQKENGILSAETSFDTEDPHAQNIASKVERGFIKGASMGISFSKKDFSYENGELVLNHCEIYEASIVAIPSNAGALRLTMDGQEVSKKEMELFCLSIEKEFKEDLNDIEKEFKKNSKKMKITLSQLSLLALGFSAQTKEIAMEEIETAVLSLEKSKKDLEAKLLLSEEKVNVFIEKEKQTKLLAIKDLLDNAILSGKITADKRQTFEKLALDNFDLAKDTLDALPAKKTFSAGVQTPAGTSGVATMEDFQKLSLDEQLAFKNTNPEGYKAICAKV